MANYSQLQTSVQNLLNRRDVTTAQLQAFIASAIQRIQRGQLRDDTKGGESRPLRIPAMENSLLVTATAQPVNNNPAPLLAIPSDLLELINLIPQTVNGGRSPSSFTRLTKTDLTTATQASINIGQPEWYARQGAGWVVGPAMAIGDTIRIDYYQELAPLVNATDTNAISIIAPDLIIYGALCFAADFYTDVRLQQWETRFAEIWSALADQGMEDEENGGTAVQKAFSYPDDLNDGWDYFNQGPFGIF